MTVIDEMTNVDLLNAWQELRTQIRNPNTRCGDADALGEQADDIMDEIGYRTGLLTGVSKKGDFVSHNHWTWLVTEVTRTPFDNGTNISALRIHDNHKAQFTFMD